MIFKYFSTLFLVILLLGCSDNSISMVHNKKILDKEIECLRLLVFPPDELIESSLRSLYDFDTTCELDLVVSYKNSITCNSNQNAQNKAYGMPKAYLRLEVKQKNALYYSYYTDLSENITSGDIKAAFDKMRDELNFKKEHK